MKGVYVFKQNSRVIGTTNNLITTEGKRIVQRYLAGQVKNIAEVIAIGVGSTPATISDTNLGFEFDRAGIDLISPDLVAGTLVFRATFSQLSSGLISEIGTYSLADSSSPYSSKLILKFDSSTEAWTGGAFALDNNRIGGDLYRLSPAVSATATATLANVGLDFTGYSNSDKISLAYFVTNAFTSSITLRLKVDSSNYFQYVINTPAAGYKINTFYKSDFSLVGIPTWGNILSVDVLATSTAGGAAIIDLDGFRVDDSDYSNPNYVLVSHSVLTSPIQKLNTAPLEIEYSLVVSV